MTNIGEEHTRTATSIVSGFVEVGGLTEFLFTGCWIAYLFFGQPFRELDFAISYTKLLSRIWLNNGYEIDKLEQKLSLCFYLKYFLNRRLGLMFQGDTDFQKMIRRIDSLQ